MKFGLQIEAKKHVPFNIIICAHRHGLDGLMMFFNIQMLCHWLTF